MLSLRLVYALNILVAGGAGLSLLLRPKAAAATTFPGSETGLSAPAVVGSFWIAIAVCSAIGLWKPMPMSGILVVQLLYKTTWLFAFALPAYLAGRSSDVNWGVAGFFAVWVVALPFVIPWKQLFGASSGN